jgi:LacI family repressor for deo operon, udp, cdd, tsx, nupC, and nupG
MPERKSSEKKPTYQQMASEFGVSIATISRILTVSSNVNSKTRERILPALANYGYDIAAIRANKPPSGKNILIFNIPSMGNPFYSQIAQGAKSAASRHQYHLLINEEHINENGFTNITGLIQRFNVAGLITTNHVPRELLKKLNAMLPQVQCCEFDEELNIPYVSIDDIAATRKTMEYLFSLGRRNIAFISGPFRYKYARHRLRGYLEFLEKAGIEENKEFIIQLPDINYDMAASTAEHLLCSAKKPDAFYCTSDVYAAAVIKACARLGLNIPRDVVVAGFDNVDISSMVTPAITTTNQPKFQIGFSSCELLVELINNPDMTVRNILLETELIVRESTSLVRTGGD